MRQQNKSRFFSFLNIIFTTYCLLLTTVFSIGIVYVSKAYKDLEDPRLVDIPKIYASYIYDRHDAMVKKIGSDSTKVTFEQLPVSLLDAIVAIEDQTFHDHNGIDIHRVFGSIFHNLTNDSSLQGASTLTQQLAKNLFLTPEKSLDRKIKELLLSFKLEAQYEKKTILEFYFNEVNFDPVFPGIGYAANKFFGKTPSDLTLTESATLVGLVKSPSAYEPFKHPESANNRKNLVLDKMKNNNFITENEYRHAQNIHVSSLLYTKISAQDATPYQAYIDAVYQECFKLIGLDPYSSSINIYTHLEPSLQQIVDQIQSGERIDFYDELQQFGLALLDSKTSEVLALGGGRNYNGERLFNRAYDKKVSPASTIKPIFNYLLAIEKMGFNKATTLMDEETHYLNGESLKNAGGRYAGALALVDALGYSKNTTAIKTLNELTRRYGEDYLSNYLDSIGLLDEGPYVQSYGLGGMKEGVSLINLAASYGVIANKGVYTTPSCIRKITTNDGRILYEDSLKTKQIVSPETSYIMTDLLGDLVEEDYVSLGQVKISGIKVAAKTGTGAYDSSLIRRYGFPSGSDKDAFVVGFSPDYLLATWSGFDKPIKDQKTYFHSGDKRRALTKKIFKTVLSSASNKGLIIERPPNIYETNVVKYADKLYHPNALIPSSYQIRTLLKKYEEIETYPLPIFPDVNATLIEYGDLFELNLLNRLTSDPIYNRIYGPLGYFISVDGERIGFTSNNTYEIKKDFDFKKIEVQIGYKDLSSTFGPTKIITTNPTSFNLWMEDQ